MAKQTTNLNIKGILDIDNGEIVESDKDVGEITHKLNDLLLPFNCVENITLSVSFDTIIEGKTE